MHPQLPQKPSCANCACALQKKTYTQKIMNRCSQHGTTRTPKPQKTTSTPPGQLPHLHLLQPRVAHHLRRRGPLRRVQREQPGGQRDPRGGHLALQLRLQCGPQRRTAAVPPLGSGDPILPPPSDPVHRSHRHRGEGGGGRALGSCGAGIVGTRWSASPAPGTGAAAGRRARGRGPGSLEDCGWPGTCVTPGRGRFDFGDSTCFTPARSPSPRPHSCPFLTPAYKSTQKKRRSWKGPLGPAQCKGRRPAVAEPRAVRPPLRGGGLSH